MLFFYLILLFIPHDHALKIIFAREIVLFEILCKLLEIQIIVLWGACVYSADLFCNSGKPCRLFHFWHEILTWSARRLAQVLLINFRQLTLMILFVSSQIWNILFRRLAQILDIKFSLLILLVLYSCILDINLFDSFLSEPLLSSLLDLPILPQPRFLIVLLFRQVLNEFILLSFLFQFGHPAVCATSLSASATAWSLCSGCSLRYLRLCSWPTSIWDHLGFPICVLLKGLHEWI